MPKIRSFTDVEKLLKKYETPMSNTTYSLDTIRQLADFFDNPQNDIPIIHVAGTSGKSSTSYYCAALLKKASLKVGLSVSPHIDSVAERTQINLLNLEEEKYCSYFEEFIDLLEETSLKPTYFELLVVFSYWVFARKEKVDVAVIEVGLGGLLDGTNIVTREDKICVITDIGYDHMNILGKTLNEITAQKAGIVKNGNRVYMHRQSDLVMSVVEEHVNSEKGVLNVVNQSTYKGLPLFQQRNLSLAIEVAKAFCANLDKNITDKEIEFAKNYFIPARMEEAAIDNKTVIFDGSHNDHKVSALVDALRVKYPNSSMVFLVAFGAHRKQNAIDSLEIIHEVSDKIIATEFASHQDSRQQSLSAIEIEKIAKSAGFGEVKKFKSPKDGFDYALKCKTDIAVVTGSFYLLKHVRPGK